MKQLLLILFPISCLAATVNVRDYGAAGDGVTLDQNAFIAAVAAAPAGTTIFIPDGIYLLDKPPVKRSCIEIRDKTGITFQGESRHGTVLKLRTDGGYPEHGDTHIVQVIGGGNHQFLDLTFDGSGANYLYHDEQMHELYLLNTSGITVDNVEFREARGDGMFVIGDGGFTEFVAVRNCGFHHNSRSGIANQGNIRDILYEWNVFSRISDQSIDLEPTGNRAGPLRVTIRRNWICHANNALALTLVGTSLSSPARELVVTDNFITGKVMIYRVNGIEFSRNIVQVDPQFGGRALLVRDSDNTWIHSNQFHSGGDYTVYVVYPTTHGLMFESNIVTHTGGGNGMYLDSTGTRISLRNNRFYGQRTSKTGIQWHIPVNDQIVRTDYLSEGNLVSGFLQGMRVGTVNAASRYSDFTARSNLWTIQGTFSPNLKLFAFKLGNQENATAEQVIVSPSVINPPPVGY